MAGMTSMGLVAFSLANILLPEIQAVAPPPAAANGRKGVTAAFGALSIMYPLVAICGYWAFGNSVNSLVVFSLFPPRDWKTVASKLLLVVHANFNYQVFAQPSFEIIEYLLMDTTDSLVSPKNCLSRLAGTSVYILTLSFLAALLPDALANVSTILGATCYISLDIIMPLLMHNSANRTTGARKNAHYVAATVWAAIAVGAVVGSVYDLASRASGLRFFADVGT